MVTPSRREFREFAASGLNVPVGICLPLDETAGRLFEAAAFKPPCFLLESARTHSVTGRYSFLGGEPWATLLAKGDPDPLPVLAQRLKESAAVRVPGLPPFVGGAVGFFGFDAYRYFETFFNKAQDDLNLPDLGFLFCDQVVALDHLEGKLWAVVLARPGENPDRAYGEALARAEALLRRVTRSPKAGEGLRVKGEADSFPSPSALHPPPVLATHTRASFETMVRQAKAFIADGEIYQANLSQRFSAPLESSPWEMYQRLRGINPSPFAAFADWGDLQIVCASPERLLRVEGRRVETRPIAGTRPRGSTAVETARLRQELILNEKERAEHLMLVDLERNDLGRVCRYGSVKVDEWMALEEYSHVIHIVSNVRGTLRPNAGPLDLIRAAFPGGTITGCPKIRCLEVIDALEPVRRQLYTGSLGYFSATGQIDFNLLIRTAFVAGGVVHIQGGAGIVADSDPGREYEETLHKLRALMEAFHVEPRTDTEPVPVAACS